MDGDESSSPGPEVAVAAAVPVRRPANDDLDDLIEDAFGPTTTRAPGRFDAGLIATGAGLAAWWLFSGSASPWLAIGVALVALGGALPLRSLPLSASPRRQWRAPRGGGRIGAGATRARRGRRAGGRAGATRPRGRARGPAPGPVCRRDRAARGAPAAFLRARRRRLDPPLGPVRPRHDAA